MDNQPKITFSINQSDGAEIVAICEDNDISVAEFCANAVLWVVYNYADIAVKTPHLDRKGEYVL